MRRFILLFAVVLLVAGPASAKTIQWHGTVLLKLSTYYPMILDAGSGVATVNNSSGGAHLSTLRIVGDDIPDSGVWLVTDPESTPQVKAIIITGTLKSGTMTGISGGAAMPPGILPMAGYTRVCLFVPGCTANIHMNNTYNMTRGAGIAGTITMGGLGSVRVSVQGAPWNLATVTQIMQTAAGNFVTLSRAGFVHGGASATDSSTAVTSGVINFVGPNTVKTIGITGNSQTMSLFIDFRLHFIPEPGLLLLLGSGVVGLGVLGRSRMRK
jgi:hypothetical protein